VDLTDFPESLSIEHRGCEIRSNDLLKRIISERFTDTHHERSDVASFQVERLAFMAMTTTAMMMPHPTTDHVVGQWMNRKATSDNSGVARDCRGLQMPHI
jgi:hypothetical protein